MRSSISVVLFTGGALLEPDVRELLRRLVDEERVEVAACFRQAPRPGLAGHVADAWRRRRLLALPVLAQRVVRAVARVARSPVAAARRRRAERGLGERLHVVPDLHAPEVVESVRRLQPDLGLVYGGPIVREALFGVPRLGCLGIHHGEVPRYRGRKTFFWALHAGEPHVGVTIQKIGTSLDGGDVVGAARVTTGRRLPGRIWRELEARGLELFVEAVRAARDGTLTARRQDGPRGRLCKEPSARDVAVFWWRTLRRVVL